jgi:hypothetical protein
MDGLISKVRSKATGSEEPGAAPTHTLFFCPSDIDLGLITVHHSSYPRDAPPLFTIKATDGMSMSLEESDYLFFQNGQFMGQADFSLNSTKINMSLRGRPIQMKQSNISGNFSLDVPPLSLLKWKVNQLTGGSLQLFDESGVKLAKIGKSSTLGGSDAGQKLEVFIPADEFFVDLCMISGFAAWTLNRTTNKVVKEVVQAMPGPDKH